MSQFPTKYSANSGGSQPRFPGTRKSVEKSHAAAFALSLSVAYPTRENTIFLPQIAHQNAYALSMNAAIPDEETIVDLIRKAHSETLNLANTLKM